MTTAADQIRVFGEYELDPAAGELRRLGRDLRLQPQPFKLLVLLVMQAGNIVTRDEIRRELWAEDTFVDFDQGMNYCIRQIREALGDDAERPMFVQTVPKRGYRFIAPTSKPLPASPPPSTVDTKLMRAVWTNIAELRLASERQKARRRLLVKAVLAVAFLTATGLVLLRW